MRLEARSRVPRTLPQTTFTEERSHGYAHAPLDMISLHNGVAKFDHLQHGLSGKEVDFILMCLEDCFPFLGEHSDMATDAKVLELIEEKKDKAAGDPWRVIGGHNKGQALTRYGLQQLTQYYQQYTTVISSTLKDELRPEGKDARFFRPQDISSYIEGARLFQCQNDYLTRTGMSPIFSCFRVPGLDVIRMFKSLEDLHGENFAADGSQWDAHFPLVIAAIIAEFRIRAGLDRDRVERYYSQMYNGYTLVIDEVVHLVGQPSGHFCTTVDNSLCHIALMALHAYRKGWSLSRFRKELRFYCCGDDLIWSSTSPVFRPRDLQETYNSVGIYLEFQSFESLPVRDLVFVGVKLQERVVSGREYRLFCLVSPRSFASLHIHKRKTEKRPVLKLAKFAALAILWFADEDKYKLAREMFRQELARNVRKNLLSVNNPEVVGLWRATTELSLLRSYMEWEQLHSVSEQLLSQTLAELARGFKFAPCRKLCERSSRRGPQTLGKPPVDGIGV